MQISKVAKFPNVRLPAHCGIKTTRPLQTSQDSLLNLRNKDDKAYLRNKDDKAFTNFTRFSPELFHLTLEKIEAQITKQDTNWRKALKQDFKLAVILRFLATWDSFQSLA